MNIELHMVVWNEARLLPLVLKYYSEICTKIIIHDGYSDDGSQDIARSFGAEVRNYGIKGKMDDAALIHLKNNCWKGSRADLVIVCDTDEVLYAPNLKMQLDLAIKNGYTIFKTQGWSVYGHMPKNDILANTDGVRDDAYAKAIIFDPKAIENMNYTPGAHKCAPIGRVKFAPISLWVLHYRKIGPLQWYIDRCKECAKRRSHNNKVHGWSIHYAYSEAKITQEYESAVEKLSQFKPYDDYFLKIW